MSNPIVDKTNRYIAGTYARAPFALVQGQGMVVTDSDGKQYLDFGSGIAVNALGHADPEIVEAVADQVGQLSHTCNLYYTAPQADLAELLCTHSFADKVFFTNSGGEAIEAAIKFSRKYARTTYGPGKTEMVAFTNAFHGRTAGSLALTPREKYQAPFRPLMPDVRIARFNDIAAAEKVIGPETAAVFVEPIQGEGGIVVPPTGYLKAARELCRKARVLFVADEIQTGLGRTGRLFACDHEDVKPDVLILGKALGGGLMPVSAVLASREILGVFEPGDHGSTFGGNPLACAVARAAMRVLVRDRLAERAAVLGGAFMMRLRSLASRNVREVRGRGLLIGIELKREAGPAKAFAKKLMNEGVLCKDTVENVLRIAPPLVIEPEELDWAFEHIARVLG